MCKYNNIIKLRKIHRHSILYFTDAIFCLTSKKYVLNVTLLNINFGPKKLCIGNAMYHNIIILPNIFNFAT